MKRRIKAFLATLFVFIAISFSVCAFADNGSTVVYITRTGECYHKGSCSYLKSKIETTLADAVARGYRPCSRCKPPRLDSSAPVETQTPEITVPSTRSYNSSTSTGSSSYSSSSYSKSSSSSTYSTYLNNTSRTNSDSSAGFGIGTLIIVGTIAYIIGKTSGKKKATVVVNENVPKSPASYTRNSTRSNQTIPFQPTHPVPVSPPTNSITIKCPKCGSKMVIRHGRYGSFYGCTRYPHCRGTRSIKRTP